MYLLINTDEYSHRLVRAPSWEQTALKPASLTVMKLHFHFLAPEPTAWNPSGWFRSGLDVYKTVWMVLKRAGGFKMVFNIYMYSSTGLCMLLRLYIKTFIPHLVI